MASGEVVVGVDNVRMDHPDLLEILAKSWEDADGDGVVIIQSGGNWILILAMSMGLMMMR